MSIVSDIDQFIVDRLSLIKIDGVPIPVLPYESSRNKGHMVYPCFTITRVGFEEDRSRRRFGIDVVTPSNETKVVMTGSNTAVKMPVSFTVQPYPGIYSMRYILDAEAVVKEHADIMMIMMYQAFPFGFEPNISGQYVYFRFTKPINKDELSKPLFKLSYLFDVDGVRIERLDTMESPPITRQVFDFNTTEKPPFKDALEDYDKVYTVTTA